MMAMAGLVLAYQTVQSQAVNFEQSGTAIRPGLVRQRVIVFG